MQLDQRLRLEIGVPEGENERINNALSTAAIYVQSATSGATVAPEVVDDCVIACAADLYNMRDARLGVMDVGSADIQPYRISADPLRSVWPRLRAAGVLTGSQVIA